LLDRLGTGEACPHGNRVEATRRRIAGIAACGRWTKCPPTSDAIVVSVFERDRRLLEYLHGLGIHPGAVVKMLASNYDDTLTLRYRWKAGSVGRSRGREGLDRGVAG
jgi:DtxR family Mn-dependent transcriptional regulator